jgi:hypothetical protein
LILVAPLQVQGIIWGRLKGIWSQFLPAFLIFGATVWFGHGYITTSRTGLPPGLLLAITVSTFLTVPVLGLYFSLKTKNFVGAWMLTCLTAAVTIALPHLLLSTLGGWASGFFIGGRPALDEGSLLLWTLLSQGGFAYFAFERMQRDLNERRFPLAQSAA